MLSRGEEGAQAHQVWAIYLLRDGIEFSSDVLAKLRQILGVFVKWQSPHACQVYYTPCPREPPAWEPSAHSRLLGGETNHLRFVVATRFPLNATHVSRYHQRKEQESGLHPLAVTNPHVYSLPNVTVRRYSCCH